ncbi:G domain-containing protein [Mycena venus]|uniref:G domain-containing protein n=1 Tax=Mycena venus TaxID=2733690 RepID=A0A8H7CF26_9AGAR|nr:G domain-containing protein [Mycena venus]
MFHEPNFNEELKSTFDKIIESRPKYAICDADAPRHDRNPRFHILLVGCSGVGKSALINAVFGSGVVDEEHGRQAGIVKDINREFVLPNNDRLEYLSGIIIPFDSAFGLCNEIPVYGGSLFEIAEEKILNSTDLETPIIVVFTKFDKPVLKIKQELLKTEDQNTTNTVARSKARETFCTDYAAALSTLPKSIPMMLDIRQLLKSNLFKKMTSVQEDLFENDSSSLPKITLGGTAAVAGIISGVIPPAVPFAVPIAADITKHSGRPQVVRALMGYIVDLTIVMQSLFCLTRARAEAVSKGGAMTATVSLTKHPVELTFTAYATDEHSETIHEDLRQFVKPMFALKPDIVLDHIIELIKSHRFQPSQSSAAKAEAGRETGEEDVNWETGVRA